MVVTSYSFSKDSFTYKSRSKFCFQNPSSDNAFIQHIGYEAKSRAAALSLRHPVEHGIVTNWSDMETVWNYIFFEELRMNPEKHPVLLTESSLNPAYNREKMAQVVIHVATLIGSSSTGTIVQNQSI